MSEPTICDTCLDAIIEEAPYLYPLTEEPYDPVADDALLRSLCVEYGSEIPDHLCQRVETGERCDCDCARHTAR